MLLHARSAYKNRLFCGDRSKVLIYGWAAAAFSLNRTAVQLYMMKQSKSVYAEKEAVRKLSFFHFSLAF